MFAFCCVCMNPDYYDYSPDYLSTVQSSNINVI